MSLSFPAFVASRVSSASLSLDMAEYVETPGAVAFHVYADAYLIHEADGLFWVHAWWYAPLSYATLAEAEAELFLWYCEFT